MRATMLTLLLLTTPAWAQEAVHDFRGGRFDEGLFQFSSPEAAEYIKPEKEGLRFRLPGEKSPKAPVGIQQVREIEGNFAVTVDYEILAVDRPDKGYGVGVELYMIVQNPTRDGIVLSRLMRPKEGPQFMFSYMTTLENGKRVAKSYRNSETTNQSNTGRLRLAREGATLIASVAEADGPLQEIQRMEIGVLPMRAIRFSAISGGNPAAKLDVRLLEYRLAEGPAPLGKAAPPGEPAALPPPQPPGQRRLFWTIGILVGGSLVVVGSVGVFVLWRVLRRKPANAKSREAIAVDEPRPKMRTKTRSD